jgi:hypothetical protein
MGSDIVVDAVAVAQNAPAIKRLRPFEQAVRNFAHLLGGVPDCAAGELGDEEVDLLSSMGSQVIDEIERRLDDETVDDADQQKLVSVVYRIRRHLEEMEMWRRHYSGVRSR